jgi:hypothetical protein
MAETGALEWFGGIYNNENMRAVCGFFISPLVMLTRKGT